MVKTILPGFGSLALICSALASTLSNENEPARNAALQWLQVIDSGDYNDAALMLSDYARASRDWPNYLANARAPFGRVRNRNVAELKRASTVPGDPEFRQHAIVRFNTAFEKGTAVEEIVLAKAGCCWEPMNYSITAARNR